MSNIRVVIAALAVGTAWSGGLPSLSVDSLAELAPGHVDAASQQYDLDAVKGAEVVKTVTATGTIDATINVEVGSQLSGQIANLLVDFNDTVRKGQVLAELDEGTFRAQVNSARAALEGAKADVRVAEVKLVRAKIDSEHIASQRAGLAARVEVARLASEIAIREAQRKAMLGGKGVIATSEAEDAGSRSQEAAAARREAEANLATQNVLEKAAQADIVRVVAELDVARAAAHRSEAQVESAAIDLERTRIRSPIDGVVVGRNVTRGQTLASTLETRTLFVVAGDLRRMQVLTRVDESDISQIAIGQKAEFTVDSFPDRRFEGVVSQIRKEPNIIQNVVTYIVVLSTDNDDLALLPGMTVVAKIETARSAGPVTVPLAALRFHPRLQGDATAPAPPASASVVWTLRGGTPRPVRVTVGSQDGERAAITSGDLHLGDRVLTGEKAPDGLAQPRRRGDG
jgi:HlyD family secretion protein